MDIYLYGSYARGDYKADSDIDIMILVKANDEEIKKYDDELFRFSADVVNTTAKIKEIDPNAKFEYDLEKLEFNSKRVIRQDQYVKDKDGKIFGNTIMEFIIVDKEPADVGETLQ